MIQIKKNKDGYFDEHLNGVLVRHFAETSITGWLSTMNFTPTAKSFSDILNLDIVIAALPPVLAGRNYDFDYSGVDRLATRVGFGLGQYRHVHLMVDQQQINQLKKLMYSKIKIMGSEIAVTHTGEGSFFLVDPRVPAWLGLPPDHQLAGEIRAGCNRNKKLNRTSCHSIKPTTIKQFNKGEKIMGSSMNGQFAIGAAAVTGAGQQLAKNAIQNRQKKIDEMLQKSRKPQNKKGEK